MGRAVAEGGVPRVEFVVGEIPDPGLFSLHGPARSAADERAEDEARQEAVQARRHQWFARNVTSRPLRVELDLDVVVHEYDEATGAFEAGLGQIGLLARRTS